MNKMRRRFRYCIASAGLVLAALSTLSAPAFAQGQGSYRPGPGETPVPMAGGFDKIHALPPGGPAPRMADGHVDLTGRWYPDAAGRMLQFAYPVDQVALQQFDPKVTPEVPPVFNAGMKEKYARRDPEGGAECDQAGTPSTTLEQDAQHAPMEILANPGRVVMLYEYPMDVRMVYMNRQHPKDPDPTFNGDTTAHWEGDTLVLDVIAIDERMRNFGGENSGGWYHSDKQHIIERITRTSKNYISYQITIEDPVVLAQPWKSAARTWTLAQDPHDEWGEVFCTLNEEPEEFKRIQDEAKTKGK